MGSNNVPNNTIGNAKRRNYSTPENDVKKKNLSRDWRDDIAY